MITVISAGLLAGCRGRSESTVVPKQYPAESSMEQDTNSPSLSADAIREFSPEALGGIAVSEETGIGAE